MAVYCGLMTDVVTSSRETRTVPNDHTTCDRQTDGQTVAFMTDVTCWQSCLVIRRSAPAPRRSLKNYTSLFVCLFIIVL